MEGEINGPCRLSPFPSSPLPLSRGLYRRPPPPPSTMNPDFAMMIRTEVCTPFRTAPGTAAPADRRLQLHTASSAPSAGPSNDNAGCEVWPRECPGGTNPSTAARPCGTESVLASCPCPRASFGSATEDDRSPTQTPDQQCHRGFDRGTHWAVTRDHNNNRQSRIPHPCASDAPSCEPLPISLNSAHLPNAYIPRWL